MSDNLPQDSQTKPSDLRQALGVIAHSMLALLKSRALWRLILIFSIISILAMMVLGFAFYLIVIGIMMASIRLSSIFRPIRRFIAWISGVSEDKSIFPKINKPFWTKLMFVWHIIPYFGLVIFGVWLLVKNGFLSQNLIYFLFIR